MHYRKPNTNEGGAVKIASSILFRPERKDMFCYLI